MRPRLLVIVSFTLMPDLLQSKLPGSCRLTSSVLICTKLKNIKIKDVLSAVMYEIDIDFVFFDMPHQRCTCRILNLARLLRVTDVIVVTMTNCGLSHFQSCGLNQTLPDPEVVAGLAVMTGDRRRNWAIKHHVMNLWYKIHEIGSAELRIRFYNAIIKGIKDEIQSLETRTIANNKPLIQSASLDTNFLDKLVEAERTTVPPVPTTESRFVSFFRRYKSQNLEAKPDTTQSTGTPIPQLQTQPEQKTKQRPPSRSQTRRRGKTAKPRKPGRRRKTGRRRQDIYSKSNRPYTYRAKRSAKVMDIRKTINKTLKYHYDEDRIPRNITVQPHEQIWNVRSDHGLWISSKTATMRKKRYIVSIMPRVVPYLAFVGGEYYSIFDSDGISVALRREQILPASDNGIGKPPRIYPKGGGMMLPLPDDGRKGNVALDQQRAKKRGQKLTESPLSRGELLSDSEIKAMTKESDHRMKSFIIFFVAITGVITVIAVLLIMAMKSSGQLSGLQRFVEPGENCPHCQRRRRNREQLINLHERDMHRRRPVVSFYEGAEFPEECLMTREQFMLDKASGPNEKFTQTEVKIQPVLGGRHVVTQFESWCTDMPDNLKSSSVTDQMPDKIRGPSHFHVTPHPDQTTNAFLDLPGGGRNVIDVNASRWTEQHGRRSPLVSFLNSIVKEKDGVIRDNHRERFNVKRRSRLNQYQPRLHGDLIATGLHRVPPRGPRISTGNTINLNSSRGLSQSEMRELDNKNSNCSSETSIKQVEENRNQIRYRSCSGSGSSQFLDRTRPVSCFQTPNNLLRGQVVELTDIPGRQTIIGSDYSEINSATTVRCTKRSCTSTPRVSSKLARQNGHPAGTSQTCRPAWPSHLDDCDHEPVLNVLKAHLIVDDQAQKRASHRSGLVNTGKSHPSTCHVPGHHSSRGSQTCQDAPRVARAHSYRNLVAASKLKATPLLRHDSQFHRISPKRPANERAAHALKYSRTGIIISGADGRTEKNISEDAGRTEKNISEAEGQIEKNISGDLGRTKKNRGDAGRTEKNISGDAGRTEKNISGDAGRTEKNIRGDAGHTEKNFSGDAGRTEKNISGDAGRMEKNIRGDAGHTEKNFSGDAGRTEKNISEDAGRTEKNNSEAAGRTEKNISGDAGRTEKNISGDAGRMEKNIRGDAGHTEKNFSGDAGRTEKNISEDAGRTEKNISGDADRTEKNISGDAGRMVKNISEDAGRTEKNFSGASGRAEKNKGDAGRMEKNRGDAGRTEKNRGDAGRTEKNISGAAGRTEKNISGVAGRIDKNISGDLGRMEKNRVDAGRMEKNRGDAGRMEKNISGAGGRNEKKRGDAGRTEKNRGDAGRTEKNISGAAGRTWNKINTDASHSGNKINSTAGAENRISENEGRPRNTISGDVGLIGNTIGEDAARSGNKISENGGRSSNINHRHNGPTGNAIKMDKDRAKNIHMGYLTRIGKTITRDAGRESGHNISLRSSGNQSQDATAIYLDRWDTQHRKPGSCTCRKRDPDGCKNPDCSENIDNNEETKNEINTQEDIENHIESREKSMADVSMVSPNHLSLADNKNTIRPNILDINMSHRSKSNRKTSAKKKKKSVEGSELATPLSADTMEQPPEHAASETGQGNVVAIVTDDDPVFRKLRSHNELPFNRYTSLSVILENPKFRDDLKLDNQVWSERKTEVDPLTLTTLQPVYQSTPYRISLSNWCKRQRVIQMSAVADEENKAKRRMPPVGFDFSNDEPVTCRQQPGHLSLIPAFPPTGKSLPHQHPGFNWPVAFASTPPYTSPGYNCYGIKQQVGVLPVDKVPWKPSSGIVGTHKIKVPTWVSPLYKSYGIGGPYGPNGPLPSSGDVVMRKKLKYCNCLRVRGRHLLRWIKNKFPKRKSKSTKEDQTKNTAIDLTEGKKGTPPVTTEEVKSSKNTPEDPFNSSPRRQASDQSPKVVLEKVNQDPAGHKLVDLANESQLKGPKDGHTETSAEEDLDDQDDAAKDKSELESPHPENTENPIEDDAQEDAPSEPIPDEAAEDTPHEEVSDPPQLETEESENTPVEVSENTPDEVSADLPGNDSPTKEDSEQ